MLSDLSSFILSIMHSIIEVCHVICNAWRCPCLLFPWLYIYTWEVIIDLSVLIWPEWWPCKSTYFDRAPVVIALRCMTGSGSCFQWQVSSSGCVDVRHSGLPAVLVTCLGKKQGWPGFNSNIYLGHVCPSCYHCWWRSHASSSQNQSVSSLLSNILFFHSCVLHKREVSEILKVWYFAWEIFRKNRKQHS